MKIPSTNFPFTWSNYYNRGIANPNFMNQTDRISAEILEFADYVFSFYGSSDALNEDIQKIGKSKFKREILFYCKSKAELSYIEAVSYTHLRAHET